MKKPIIYYSHPMEHGGKLLNGCGRRAFDMKVKLKDHFEMWIPEENQAKDKSMQQKIDLDALVKADIIVVDLYHFGLVINGEAVLGIGSLASVGLAYAYAFPPVTFTFVGITSFIVILFLWERG